MPSAPTLDRLILGLLGGAAVGAPLISTSMMVVRGDLTGTLWALVVIAIFVFLLLAVAGPLLQAPLWLLLRALRLQDWIAATIAGGLAFLVPPVVLALAWSDYASPPLSEELVALLACWGLPGLLAGFVAWRVTSLESS